MKLRASLLLRYHLFMRALLICLPAFVSMYASSANSAAWSPDKNIEIIAGTSPGSGIDNTARSVQALLRDKKIVNVPITVINKAGGAGAISWNYLNQHAGDGHYLAMGTLNLITNHITGANPLTYTDVTPIALLYNEYMAFTVSTRSSIKSAKDLVERLKTSPASVSFGISVGPGNVTHIAPAMLLKAVGGDPKQLKIVVFPSGVQSMAAVLGGHIDVAITSPPVVVGQHEAGNLRIIGMASEHRLGGVLADVPTWKELGYDAVVTNWRAIVGPKGMTQPQIDYWDDAFTRLSQTTEWKRDRERYYWGSEFLGSAATRAYFEQQKAVLNALLSELGLAK